MIVEIAITNTVIMAVMEKGTREGINRWETKNDKTMPTQVKVIAMIILWSFAIPIIVGHVYSKLNIKN